MEKVTPQKDAMEAASQPSIVDFFSIEGLFGYRTISFSSQYAATVLIARNGSGKTTLIAALDAFLRGQFTRFASLKFEKVVCRLRGVENDLVLYREDVERLMDLTVNSEVGARAKAWEVEPLALLELLESRFSDTKNQDLLDNPTFYTIYTKMGYDIISTRKICERLASSLVGQISNLDQLREVLNNVLRGMEIVYLPTYRRIELSLPNQDARQPGRRKSVLTRLGVARSGLNTADIQFGLGDISDRLKSLYSELLYRSNQGYGKVSANVISDLISGDYKRESATNQTPPSRESLEIFFSRIKDAEFDMRRIPYNNLVVTPDFDKVFSGDVAADAKPFLNYFLEQLNLVIQDTKGLEELVEEFIRSCNKYLSGDEPTIQRFAQEGGDLLDRKRLVFNRRDLSVKVESLATKTEIPLESLSSGEKQMISLFARLYLYQGPKIVLIDEPELSLSLDWQRDILPDVLKAPVCKQVIAITHSPFIFDNELEPFASSLKFKVSQLPEASLSPFPEINPEGLE